MPEDQAQFVHQDGSITPRRGAPSLRLLSPVSLDRQIRAVSEIRPDDQAALHRAMESLQLLREPSINTVVTTMSSLPVGEAAILADIAAALVAADRRRPKLILMLRATIEGDRS